MLYKIKKNDRHFPKINTMGGLFVMDENQKKINDLIEQYTSIDTFLKYLDKEEKESLKLGEENE